LKLSVVRVRSPVEDADSDEDVILVEKPCARQDVEMVDPPCNDNSHKSASVALTPSRELAAEQPKSMTVMDKGKLKDISLR